jgi:ring-1,2-phenylacetyl-CoA epoxidase subunit PaaB
MSEPTTPLWEVFIRSRNGLAHKHVGSLHAADDEMALQNARDVYTRRGEALSIWVVPSKAIIAAEPTDDVAPRGTPKDIRACCADDRAAQNREAGYKLALRLPPRRQGDGRAQ